MEKTIQPQGHYNHWDGEDHDRGIITISGHNFAPAMTNDWEENDLTGCRIRRYFPKRSMIHASCWGTNKKIVFIGRRERCLTCCRDCCKKACTQKTHQIVRIYCTEYSTSSSSPKAPVCDCECELEYFKLQVKVLTEYLPQFQCKPISCRKLIKLFKHADQCNLVYKQLSWDILCLSIHCYC